MNITKINTIIKSTLIWLILSGLLFTSACKKPSVKEEEEELETSTVTDADGNVYKTVKIGNQWWMAENLKTTKYRDGTSITFYNGGVSWEKDTIGLYSIYKDNLIPGLLYTWYAISNSSNIAPEGWHVPTDNDWKELERHLGMSEEEINKTGWRGTNEGDKLKIYKGPDISGTSTIKYWISFDDVFPTNESGFQAIASGYRFYTGSWDGALLNQTAFFWSSTLHEKEVWYRYLDYKKSNIFRYHGTKAYGYGVRCIKN